MHTNVSKQQASILTKLVGSYTESSETVNFKINKSIQSPAAIFFENPLNGSGIEGCAIVGFDENKILFHGPKWISHFANEKEQRGLIVPMLQREEVQFLKLKLGGSDEIVESVVSGIPVTVTFSDWTEDEHGVRLAVATIDESPSPDVLLMYEAYLNKKSVVEPVFEWPSEALKELV